MKTFLARQPLFNNKTEVVGYELLFRNSEANYATITDGYSATLKVIKDLLINFGVKQIAGNNRFFINFNEELILQHAPDLFKPESLVIEMLEDTIATKGVLEKLVEYKDKGYLIALDDFVYAEDKVELIKLADVIKIDFMQSSRTEIEEMIRVLKPYNKVLLAEKVENYDEFEFAKNLGFTVFQGYFFQKPVVLESAEIKTIPTVFTELLREFDNEEVDLGNVSEIVKKDANLTLSFLKLVNSVAYYSTNKIKSIENAIVRLGVNESSRIILINLIKSMAVEGTPSELLNVSLRRGKQAELLAKHFGLKSRSNELFILGMFSLINIIMRQSMNSILQEIPLDKDVIDALLGSRNEMSSVLELIILSERGKIKSVEKILDDRKLSVDAFNEVYLKSTVWAESIYK